MTGQNQVVFELDLRIENWASPSLVSPSRLLGWPTIAVISRNTNYINVSEEDSKVIRQYMKEKSKQGGIYFPKNIYIECILKPYYLGIIHYELACIYESDEDRDYPLEKKKSESRK